MSGFENTISLLRAMLRSFGVFLVALSFVINSNHASAQKINLASMWDFRDPALSEVRFRSALPTASKDDAFILNTQIARTFGLRRDFAKARMHLVGLQSQLEEVNAEAQTRFWLEMGRSYASAAHRPEEQDTSKARDAYTKALNASREAKLDGLLVDTIHMMAFVDRAPIDQLRWGHVALGVVLTSVQPEARAWEASIRNNLGVAHRDLAQYAEALDEFQRALSIRQNIEDGYRLHVAKWMVARALRELNRIDESLSMQLAMENERERTGAPDAFVFEELALLYEAKGDLKKAGLYRDRAKATKTN